MKISIAGHYSTKFGELWDQSLHDLLHEATTQVLDNADLDFKDIEAIYVANKAGGAFEGQLHLGALVAEWFPHFPPAMRIEGACASGSLAAIAAEQALLAGTYKTVLVVGAEKMTDTSAEETTRILSGAADLATEQGSTFPGLYALLAQAHMQKYGTTREMLSAVAVKNHLHSLDNPKAQFHKKFKIEDISQSPIIAEPLRLLDCSPISDGASAIVLTTQKMPKKTQILGMGHAQDAFNLANRDSLTELVATKKAAVQAYQQAGLQAKDMEVAEVHDCFTIAELLAIEDLGFFEKGQGGVATLAGKTQRNQKESGQKSGGQKSGEQKPKIVINPSGGLKAMGHPVGATGVKQLAVLAELIESGEYQHGLTHNVGGSGATATVHILGRGK